MKAGTKEYRKEYYLKNKSKKLEYCKEWHKNNPDRVKKSAEKRIDIKHDELKEYWKNQHKIKRENIRNYINEIKEQSRCVKCNDSRNYVLDFHHLDPSQKDFNIGDATNYSLNKIKSELEKCVVLCRNCHSEFHYFEKENNITVEEYLK